MNDRLLTPLRAAARDLIDKRLWPVALALLVAVVAVPVFIGSSASEAPAPVLPAAKPATSAPKSAITVADTAVVGHSRPGAVSDPFFDPPSPDNTSGGVSTATAPGSAKAATPSQSGTQSGSTTKTTTTTTSPSPTTNTPSPATNPDPVDTTLLRTVFRTRLSFGETAGSPVGGVSRLEALGGDANPALLYLGTTWGGGYAVFLLGPDALSQGDAECAETSCRVIAMKQGDTQIVGVRDEDGTARQYTVKIDDITRRVTDTVAAADKLRARVHADGRDVLRKMILDKPTAAAIGQFAYDRATGAVVARSDS